MHICDFWARGTEETEVREGAKMLKFPTLLLVGEGGYEEYVFWVETQKVNSVCHHLTSNYNDPRNVRDVMA